MNAKEKKNHNDNNTKNKQTSKKEKNIRGWIFMLFLDQLRFWNFVHDKSNSRASSSDMGEKDARAYFER